MVAMSKAVQEIRPLRDADLGAVRGLLLVDRYGTRRGVATGTSLMPVARGGQVAFVMGVDVVGEGDRRARFPADALNVGTLGLARVLVHMG